MKKIIRFRMLLAFAGLGAVAFPLQQAQAVFFHTVNGSIEGSLCVGNDCIETEAFSFDTIRLKENNLRIHFDDTSTTPGFPSNDWRLVANASSSGGGDYFAIEDATLGRNVFRVDAGARANALYVDAQGDVGIGTSTPTANVSVRTGNTPILRLEQDGSSGFTAQTWDLAGNETNFFLRDATGGSTLPFRVRPGAPTSAIDVAGSGNVGFGTGSPDASIHVRNTDNTTAARFTIEDTGVSGAANKPGFELATPFINGGPWRFEVNTAGKFQIDHVGSAGPELTINDETGRKVTVFGDLQVNGTIFGTVSSSSAYKKSIETVDAREVLAKVAEMPVSTWNYDLGTEVDGERHLGPMAEDFYAAFGLGRDEKSISLVDYSGVALAAIKGLSQELSERDRTIEDLEARLAKTEALVLSLTTK